MIEQLSLGICGLLFMLSLSTAITSNISRDYERAGRWFICAFICGLMAAVDLMLILGVFG